MPPGDIGCEPALQPSPSSLGPQDDLDDSVPHGPTTLVLLRIPLRILGMCNLWQSFAEVPGSSVQEDDLYSFLRRRCDLSPVFRRGGQKRVLCCLSDGTIAGRI